MNPMRSRDYQEPNTRTKQVETLAREIYMNNLYFKRVKLDWLDIRVAVRSRYRNMARDKLEVK
jgi:hypothetical protein